MLHSFGNNGEYAQMDSVYNLIIHEDHYKQDKLYALNITLDYARFLNQKGDSERANTLLTQIRENAMALEKFPENTIAHQLQEIAAIATYEIAYGQWQNNQLPAARETAEEAVSQLEQVKCELSRGLQSFRSHTPQIVHARQCHLTLSEGARHY